MQRKSAVILLTLFLATAFFGSTAFAHYLTVNVDKYHPKTNEEVTISLGMAHDFPATTSCPINRMERIFILGPDDQEKTLKMKAEGSENLVAPIKIAFDKPGTYLVVAERKKGFVCKTTDGYKYAPKKELDNVITSSWSEGNAKAIITVDFPSGEAFKKKLEDKYQVATLNDPGGLKKGEYLMAQVIYDGKPHKTTVSATYEGFAEEKDTFAYVTPTSEEKPGKIRLLEKGKWLVKVQDKFPYEKKDEADDYSFTSSLTFEIK